MESTELRTHAVSPPPSYAFDVFLSYSRKDKDFAVRLENALESYRFPKSLKNVKRGLNVFRDESDIEAADDYHRSIEQYLKGSTKLVVICSPDARKSQYVEDEIRRFIQTRGEHDIVPVLFRGKANNETVDENEKAFPEVLCENRMPLAANFLGAENYKGKLHKGPFSNSFYSILAAINDIDRRKLEQIDEKVRARRRALILSIASAIIMVLSVALVFAVISQRKAVAATKEATDAKNEAIAAGQAEKIAKDKALASANAEKFAKDEALASAEAEKIAKDKAVAAAKAEEKAKNEAVAAAKAEEIAKNEAIAQRNAAERLLYSANMNLAPQAYEAGNVSRASALLRSVGPGEGLKSKARGDGDLRGFEWFYLSGLYDRKLAEFAAQPDASAIAVSHDGKLLAISNPAKVELVDVASQKMTAFDEKADTLAFSPDGKILATGSTAGPYKLWDTATHTILDTLKKPDYAKGDQVSITFSPTGRLIATSVFENARGNRAYEVWDAVSHQLIAKFQIDGKVPGKNRGTAVALSSDDRTIAIYTGAAIEVRDLASQRQLNSFPIEDFEAIETMAFSPKGQTLMIGANDSVYVFPLLDNQPGNSFSVPKGLGTFINQSQTAIITFSPDGRTFATGVNETVLSGGEVKLWESGSFKLLATFQGIGSHGEVTSLDFSADGQILAVRGANGIQLNDTRPDRSSSVINTNEDSGSLAFSADSKKFVALEGGASPKVRAWDTATHQALPFESLVMDGRAHMASSPDAKTLAISKSASVVLWDLSSHQLVATIDMPERDAQVRTDGAPRRERVRADALAFAPDGKTIAVGLDDLSIQWWDIGRRRFLTELGSQSGRDPGAFVNQVAFSSDGKFLAALVTVTDGNSIDIWDATSRTRLGSLGYAGQNVPMCIAWAPGSKVLAVGMSGGTVELLDLASRVKEPRVKASKFIEEEERKKFVLATLEGPVKYIYSVAFSSDNKTIATGGEEGTVRLWSRISYQQLLTLDGKIGQINSVAFSPDNQTLLAGGQTGIAFWSARRNEDGPRPSFNVRR